MTSSAGQLSSLVDRKPRNVTVSAKVIRKRTKSGCLTCRKRRIKCGEQRPVCQNCIKSRRVCEYGPDGNSRRHASRDHPISYEHNHLAQQNSAPNAFNQHAFNENISQDGWQGQQQQQPHQLRWTSPPQQASGSIDWDEALDSPSMQSMPNRSAMTGDEVEQRIRALWRQKTSADSMSPPNRLSSPHSTADSSVGFGSLPPPPSSVPASAQGHYISSPFAASSTDRTANSTPSDFIKTARGPPPAFSPAPQPIHLRHYSQSRSPALHVHNAFSSHPSPSTADFHREGIAHAFDNAYSTPEAYAAFASHTVSKPASMASGSPASVGLQLPSQSLVEAAAIELVDDDYYDVESDDEQEAQKFSNQAKASFETVGIWQNFDGAGQESQELADDWAFGGEVDMYREGKAASALKNPATAKVFANFVNFTSIMLGPFQRSGNVNMSSAFGFSPPCGQNLITYTIPAMAMQDQGVLHALLALSSLQISTLQNHTSTPSMKHYAWSLRRIRHYLGTETKPNFTLILTIMLLLLHYDVNSADLIKWLANLRFVRSLLSEVDFASMTQRCHTASLAAHIRQAMVSPTTDIPGPGQVLSASKGQYLDEGLISTLCGMDVQYQSIPMSGPTGFYEPSDLELDEYHTLQDLYWWFIKDDVSQAWLYSSPLIMKFDGYTRCPPRAPIGMKGADYGAWDHVLLLVGRTMNFLAKDLPRKHAMNDANGGPWPRFPFDGIAPSPDMYMPQAGEAETFPRPSTEELPSATEAAVREWQAIVHACDVLEERLAIAYPPRALDMQDLLRTPWGPAIFYESCRVSLIWVFYYTTRVILARIHPVTMPPAMSMAVNVCAAHTANYAQQVARIISGMASISPAADPTQPSAMHDAIGAIFHNGRQFSEPAQRNAIVQILRDVESHLGQSSAGLCVSGCESAWEAMAARGIGPAYQRVREVKDPLADGHGIRLEANIPSAPSSVNGGRARLGTPESIHSGMLARDLRSLSLSPGAAAQRARSRLG